MKTTELTKTCVLFKQKTKNTINLQLICVLYSEFNVLPKNKIEVDGVEMRFKAVNDINSPDINTIYVGDEFFMFLEYKGSKYFYFSTIELDPT